MGLLFKDGQYDFQALRLLGEAVYCTADVGEVITTAERIGDRDFDGWCEEWTKTAKRLQGIADGALARGHQIGARKAYLRAANYYRTAEFYLHENPDDPRISELYDAALACFSRVMQLNHPVIEAVKISYENTTLPALYYRLENEKKPKPVMIAMNGFDGTKEELYGLAMTALEHGMNCLTIEGPGQGEVVRKQHLYFRPDYEAVITPVVDYLLALEGVDPKKIVLWGESFGGYLAPRAAAFEPRLAGCIANEGVYDFFMGTLGSVMQATGISKEEMLAAASKAPQMIEKNIRNMAKTNKGLRWGYTHGMYVFGVKTPAEFVLKVEKYNLKDAAPKIQCPTLIIDSDSDSQLDAQAKSLYDALSCEKEYMLFTAAEGAGAHCQFGARLFANERIFEWIEDTVLKSHC